LGGAGEAEVAISGLAGAGAETFLKCCCKQTAAPIGTAQKTNFGLLSVSEQLRYKKTKPGNAWLGLIRKD
jgi:adenylate kinase